MSDEESVAQPAPHALPPPSRLGTVLGWGLLAFGAACLFAAMWAAIDADAAQHAWDAAMDRSFYSRASYDAVVAAEAAYHEATVRAYALAAAGGLSLSTVPGLLYATRPALLGGPIGRLLRRAAAIWAPRRPERKHPFTFYQGIGLALPGAGWTAFAAAGIFTTLAPLAPAALWVILCAGLFNFAAIFMSIPLAGGSWWFTSDRPDPNADESNIRVEVERGG